MIQIYSLSTHIGKTMNNHANKKKTKGGGGEGGGWRQTAYLNNQLRVYGDFTLKTNFLGGEGGKRR